MMSRDWLLTVARLGGDSRGISRTLKREGHEEHYGYFKVSIW
jgi:hypothetical protein